MSDWEFIADSSAILAFLFEEPGANFIETRMGRIALSSVNFGEVVAKLVERAVPEELIDRRLSQMRFVVIPHDRGQALAAGLLRKTTRDAGLSLGDRACLALALREGVPALTADKAWARLDGLAAIHFIR